MFILAIIRLLLVLFVIFQHIYIAIMEMFFYDGGAIQRNFVLNEEFLRDERVKKMIVNQGLYNGFLAMGLIWSIFEKGLFQIQLLTFFLSCITCAAIYGGMTISKKIFFLPGLPAAIDLMSLLL